MLSMTPRKTRGGFDHCGRVAPHSELGEVIERIIMEKVRDIGPAGIGTAEIFLDPFYLLIVGQIVRHFSSQRYFLAPDLHPRAALASRVFPAETTGKKSRRNTGVGLGLDKSVAR